MTVPEFSVRALAPLGRPEDAALLEAATPPVEGGEIAPRLQRFRVDPATGCWLWTGYLDRCGYATIHWTGRNTGAHRVMYQTLVGPIPEGLTIDHLCRVRHCVNPAHMEPVTHAENCLRGFSPFSANAAKTHCIHGHEFDAENTIIRANGQRRCRACVKLIVHRRNTRRWEQGLTAAGKPRKRTRRPRRTKAQLEAAAA